MGLLIFSYGVVSRPVVVYDVPLQVKIAAVYFVPLVLYTFIFFCQWLATSCSGLGWHCIRRPAYPR